MTNRTTLVILAVGGVAGLASGLFSKAKGKGFSLPVHLIVGTIGSFHGHLLFDLIGMAPSKAVGHVIAAGVGALLFLFLLRFIKPS